MAKQRKELQILEMTHFTSASLVKTKIIIIEEQLRKTFIPEQRSELKAKLTHLFNIRRKQNKFIPPPKPFQVNRGF